ncbi:conserved hypothetical protein [Talaromyces stipitatus ATCC 10500]|uniref:Aminoglycoside phosphotransferase domain-containing protein n=1 Tax=Talaromyces stipitatus (strain ATCC 10500 / CBS 375.48 / QM 6759 / NRRL 1006) TaxID=441959 RepID=B8LT23_TALSN|nr:uncharacterized protein TSTA_069510 [Talaromyces stipitatus ATCC 10500]EED23531.1 conserved hypothetical protein [Talaromyces stipitatus ATCC 10500]
MISTMDIVDSECLEAEKPKLRLIYSETIEPPSIILDPNDLQSADTLCPDKMVAHIVLADLDMIVKLGHGVGLGEAEAMHLASTRTTIPVPKLLSAYILDGAILFVALDKSPCRDGIFEAGYGDYTKYSYVRTHPRKASTRGSFTALRDQLTPKVLEGENDIESNFSQQRVHAVPNNPRSEKPQDRNILVRTDGTIVLLDWGLAGFYPEYWEFYRELHSLPWRTSWDHMVEKFIPPFYVEYAVINRVFATVSN